MRRPSVRRSLRASAASRQKADPPRFVPGCERSHRVRHVAPGRRRRRVSQRTAGISGSACLSERKRASSEPAAGREKRRAPDAQHRAASWARRFCLLLSRLTKVGRHTPRSGRAQPGSPDWLRNVRNQVRFWLYHFDQPFGQGVHRLIRRSSNQGDCNQMKKGGLAAVCFILSCGVFSPAMATSILDEIWADHARSALRDLNGVLDEKLPALKEALPGYRSPRSKAVSLAVAPFSSGPVEPSELGVLFTFLFKHRLIETAGYTLETSPMWQRQYGKAVFAGEESFFLPAQDQDLFLKRFRERTAADYGLTGALVERDGLMHANLRLSSLTSDESILMQEYEVSADALPSLLADMIRDVLHALEIDIRRPEMLRQQHPASLETLRDILAFPCDRGRCEKRQAHLDTLLRETPFPSAVIWFSQASERGDPRAVEALQFGLSLWPEHGLLRYLRARHLPRGERRAPNRERMRLVTDLATRYPDFLEFQVRAALDLAWCCYAREALTLARSLLLRHPAHYRAWLIYANSLSRYAWNIRGNHPWSRVPQRGKRQFPRLMPIIERAVERALNLNEYESDAWIQRAIHPPGASPQTRMALARAIELSPHDPWAYEAGMLNFRRVWGGSIREQMEYFELAVDNNPEAQWPFDLHRSTYVQGSKWRVRTAGLINRLGCGRNCRRYLSWSLGSLLVLSAAVMLLVWHRKRQGYY